jgi:hypothetical protein
MENFMQYIISCCNHPLFAIIGAATTILIFFGIIYRTACWIFCITPIAFRFGIALQKREVAIFGDDAAFGNLRECLVDSKIFKNKSIIHIRSNNIDKAKDKSIFLIDWSSAEKDIEEIFVARKNHQTPVVIYAKPSTIPQDKMTDIAKRANTVVVNFRGRLLNDILTSLVTTSYDRN